MGSFNLCLMLLGALALRATGESNRHAASGALSVIFNEAQESAALKQLETTLKGSHTLDAHTGSNAIEEAMSRGWWDVTDHILGTAWAQGVDLSTSVHQTAAKIRSKLNAITDKLSKLHHSPKSSAISPAFEWAQSPDSVFLNVKFAHKLDTPATLGCEIEDILFNDSSVALTAHCNTKHKIFHLQLDLLRGINVTECSWSMSSVGRTMVTLRKATMSTWPRLLVGSKKPANMHVWWAMKEKYDSELVAFEKRQREEKERERERERERAAQASAAAAAGASDAPPDSDPAAAEEAATPAAASTPTSTPGTEWSSSRSVDVNTEPMTPGSSDALYVEASATTDTTEPFRSLTPQAAVGVDAGGAQEAEEAGSSGVEGAEEVVEAPTKEQYSGPSTFFGIPMAAAQSLPAHLPQPDFHEEYVEAEVEPSGEARSPDDVHVPPHRRATTKPTPRATKPKSKGNKPARAGRSTASAPQQPGKRQFSTGDMYEMLKGSLEARRDGELRSVPTDKSGRQARAEINARFDQELAELRAQMQAS